LGLGGLIIERVQYTIEKELSISARSIAEHPAPEGLATLYGSALAEHLVFKGGLSLSKIYHFGAVFRECWI